MKAFDYIRATSVAEAVAAAARPGAAYLAAGTNLVDLMKGGVATPERVVDITRLPGLSSIERLPDGATRIGTLVRNSDLAHDAMFEKTYPMVAEALLAGASAHGSSPRGASPSVRPGIQSWARPRLHSTERKETCFGSGPPRMCHRQSSEANENATKI